VIVIPAVAIIGDADIVFPDRGACAGLVLSFIIIYIIIVDLCSVEETSSPAIIYIFGVEIYTLLLLLQHCGPVIYIRSPYPHQTIEHHFYYY